MSLSWAFTGILALKYAYNSRRGVKKMGISKTENSL